MVTIKRFRPPDEDEEPTKSAPPLARVKALDVRAFSHLCRKHGLPSPDAEVRFHPVRRWRLDLAWTDLKVGLEVHGAVHAQGRHTRGRATAGDWEKMSEAQILGWIVLQVPRSLDHNEDWISLDTIDLCRRALALQRRRTGQGPSALDAQCANRPNL